MILKSLEEIAYKLKLGDENRIKAFADNIDLKHKELMKDFPPIKMIGCRHTFYNLTTKRLNYSEKLKYELNIHYGYRKNILQNSFNIYHHEVIDNLIDIRNELLIVSLDILEGNNLSLKIKEKVVKILIDEIKKENLVKYMVVKNNDDIEKEFYEYLGFREMLLNDYYILKNSSCDINYKMILKLE